MWQHENNGWNKMPQYLQLNSLVWFRPGSNRCVDWAFTYFVSNINLRNEWKQTPSGQDYTDSTSGQCCAWAIVSICIMHSYDFLHPLNPASCETASLLSPTPSWLPFCKLFQYLNGFFLSRQCTLHWSTECQPDLRYTDNEIGKGSSNFVLANCWKSGLRLTPKHRAEAMTVW